MFQYGLTGGGGVMHPPWVDYFNKGDSSADGLQQTATGENIKDMSSFSQGWENWWTGSLDYARELEKLGIQNQFSAQEAQKNRDWQERMSNTAYSRAVQDMKNAGLNPYLMYGSASAAATPAGAVAQTGNGHLNASPKGPSSLISAIASLTGSAVKLGALFAGL